MLPLSGDQFAIEGAGYRAVVTESGAALRLLEHAGRPLVDGFGEDAMASGGRGQLLMPWPNRIRDGEYSFGGAEHRLALTEPSRHNASHGLARWAAWTVEEHTANSVSLGYRLMAQSGYPWTLDLHVLYDLSAEGLTVTQTATNMSGSAAPYAQGAHPYLVAGSTPMDAWELTLPAATRLLVDERLLPVSREGVDGTAYDFRVARPIADTLFDDAFTDLTRDADGVVTVTVRDPATGRGTQLWADGRYGWLQIYTGDDSPTPRRSVAVEPMTAPADAFRSGDDLTMLAPQGAPGHELSASWGIRTLE